MDLLLLVGVVAIAITAFFTLMSFFVGWRYKASAAASKALYEDKDGTASAATQQQFSTRIQTLLSTSCAIVGFALALTSAILYNNKAYSHSHSFQHAGLGWIPVALWVLILVQRLQILRQRSPVTVFRLSLVEALSFLVIASLYLLALYDRVGSQRSFQRRSDVVSTALTTSSLFVAIAGLWSDVTVPRRPQLYHDGHPVDGIHTVSVLERYTFSWPSHLLREVASGMMLELNSLPTLGHDRRAKVLHDQFNSIKDRFGGSLVKILAIAHAKGFLSQAFMATVEAVLSATPQLAMYNLLKQLEAKSAGLDVTVKAALWAVALGVALILHSFFGNILWWIGFADVGARLRIQLSALIYAKTTKRRDVRGISVKSKNEDDKKTKNGSRNDAEAAGGKDKNQPKSGEDPEEDPEEAIKQSRQAVINLIGVDTGRISMATFAVASVYSTLCHLAVLITLLAFLVGWLPLVAGAVVQLLLMPLNTYLSKIYVAGQNNLMQLRDKKVAVVNEALTGIRQIKFSALEQEWQKKIMDVREQELSAISRIFLFDTFLFGVWTMGPVLMSLAVISAYALLHRELPPSVAFTAISLLTSFESMLSILPEMMTRIIDAYVSVKRVGEYLDGPERAQIALPGQQIAFNNAAITWPTEAESIEDTEDTFVLRNLNIAFPVGQLSVISGPTGSGKSLLLHAILGEASLVSGTITVPETPTLHERHDEAANQSNWIIPSVRAFVSQQPWIQNMSIKDNILFGLPFYEQRYRAVLSACALDKDLEVFEDGDQTEVGPKGINLSGGQQWRVTLARALYSRAGILVMDDIFSAVDAHVGRHIFENAVIGDICNGRTRILVTHHVGLVLPSTKYEVHLGGGTVKHAGFVDKMKEQQLRAIIQEEQQEAKVHASETEQPSSAPNTKSDGVEGDGEAQKKTAPKKFVEEESQKTGWTGMRVYRLYLDACGGWSFWLIVLLLFGGFEALFLGRGWVLKEWTENYRTEGLQPTGDDNFFRYQTPRTNASVITAANGLNETLKFYLMLYAGLSLALCVVGSLRFLFIFRGSVQGSRKLFEGITISYGATLENVVKLTFSSTLVSPLVIICAIVLFAACARFGLYSVASSRQVTRLESIARSPMFDFFSSSLTGISTIRAFNRAESFIGMMFERIDKHARAQYLRMVIERWLAWRLDITGAAFSTAIAILIVGLRGDYASLGGFALSFALQYSNTIASVIRNVSALELGMNGIERIVEYSEIAIENEQGSDVPSHWPSKGRIEVNNLVVGYAPDLPPVLKGLTFDVNGGERIGVVGRTGAGKSSLTLALFRFLEARQGSIRIDGIDISKIRLHDLRSRVAIIPQDPVLFSGTIRSNLDPFDEYDEETLKNSLERVHLVETAEEPVETAVAEASTSSSSSTIVAPDAPVKNRVLSLSTKVSESGLNLSQGQRQLLCLARALVRQPRLLVLDEATSAVDRETDALIQRSIRAEFAGATLLVIAHRLSTVADFDRLLVLSDGEIVEFGTPRELLVTPGGVFAGMVDGSGEAEALRDTILRAAHA